MTCESHFFIIGVVDDDASVREALESLFGSFGFRTCGFGSAEELLRSSPTSRLDCVILDVRMDGMNGLDLQARLKEARPELPTIFVTSHDDASTRARAIDGGAVAVFGKPFDRHALISTIEALRRQRAS